jgi:hypothetical protein
MNINKMWIAVLSGAVLTTLVSNLPLIGLINMLCFAGFWASAIFTIWLYRRLSGKVTLTEGALIGVLTGLCAGVMGFGLSFLGMAGFQGIANELAGVLPPEELQGMENIPFWGVLVFNLVGVFFNVIFGSIGGLIGGAIFRIDRKNRQAANGA